MRGWCRRRSAVASVKTASSGQRPAQYGDRRRKPPSTRPLADGKRRAETAASQREPRSRPVGGLQHARCRLERNGERRGVGRDGRTFVSIDEQLQSGLLPHSVGLELLACMSLAIACSMSTVLQLLIMSVPITVFCLLREITPESLSIFWNFLTNIQKIVPENLKAPEILFVPSYVGYLSLYLTHGLIWWSAQGDWAHSPPNCV